VIDSLQLTANYSVATPVNWKNGRRRHHRPGGLRRGRQGEVPKGWKALKPYLRVTPQPNK